MAALTDATPFSRSSTLATHGRPVRAVDARSTSSVGVEDAPGRADADRQQRPLGHDPAQTVGGLQRDHAAPRRALAHVQLHALARLVAERLQRRAGVLGEREPVGRGPPQPHEAEPEREPTRGIAPQQSVRHECGGEAVGGRPGEAGRRLQLGQTERAVGLDGAQHDDRLVEHADVGDGSAGGVVGRIGIAVCRAGP